MIKLTLLSPFREVVGKKELEIELSVLEDHTAQGLLNKLCNDYPKLREQLFDTDTGKITDYLNIFVDGKPIRSNEELASIELKSDSEVLLFIPIAGG